MQDVDNINRCSSCPHQLCKDCSKFSHTTYTRGIWVDFPSTKIVSSFDECERCDGLVCNLGYYATGIDDRGHLILPDEVYRWGTDRHPDFYGQKIQYYDKEAYPYCSRTRWLQGVPPDMAAETVCPRCDD